MTTVDARGEAIAMLKRGDQPDAIVRYLASRGVAMVEVERMVNELVALKHQAEAMNPVRLHQEAKWRFVGGASVEEVVAYYTSLGIAEDPARKEAKHMEQVARSLRLCPRCGAPTEPAAMAMDLDGTTFCAGCSQRATIRVTEDRGAHSVDEGLLLVVPVLAGAAMLAQAAESEPGAPDCRPGCDSCRVGDAVHASALTPEAREKYPATLEWACKRCGRAIG